jgi:cation:H+ antiporter
VTNPCTGASIKVTILTAAFGVILIGFVDALLILSRNSLAFPFLQISAYTPLIIILYVVAMRSAFVYELRRKPAPQIGRTDPTITLKEAIGRYLVAAGIVAGAGTWLPFVGVELADVMGWRTTFVGTLFVAAATSLPELIVTISTLCLGAVEMGIANLLGSNLFDVLVLAIDGLAYTEGPLLSSVSTTHAVSALQRSSCSGIFIVALLYRPETRVFDVIGWVSLSLLMVYLLSSYAIYLHGH